MWRSIFIKSLIFLKYLKPNTETYTYEAASYFGTSEGEFKTRYNNHKKLLAPL